MTSRIFRPKTAGQWAKEWKVHRNTARKMLREAERLYGDTVQKRGRQGALTMSDAGIAKVRAAFDAQGNKDALAMLIAAIEERVTKEQFAATIEKLWAAIRKLETRAA